MWQVIDSLSAQKLVTTNSGKLLGSVPLRQVRRLVKRGNSLKVYRLKNKRLSQSELRRVSYHIRARRGDALFARCWLLVEGESEFWLMPELARVMGHNFEMEGVSCIEFAQCGVAPLIKLATNFGIEWHLLVDGDDAGRSYARHAYDLLNHDTEQERISMIEESDVEHCLWHYGYENVFRKYADEVKATGRRKHHQPAAVIGRAIRARSKPGLALALAESIGRAGSPGIPPILGQAIEKTLALARKSAG
jgi:putative ATP-dependent endonuclease of OLD family